MRSARRGCGRARCRQTEISPGRRTNPPEEHTMALFGKDPAPPRTPARSEPVSVASAAVIGKKIVVDGKVGGGDDLVIEGQVKGEIRLDANLTIGQSARIEARVHAKSVTVDGTIVGDVSADVRVELRPSANVEGNIKAPKIVVAEGAVLKGAVDMGGSKSQTKVSTTSD
jgi:cytoskeletal protein CcmA (bactofilin family)